MVKLTKIYTRTGDEGETHLAGGSRVSKNSPRITAIGEVDELNSWIGYIVVSSRENKKLKDFAEFAISIQQTLFNLGAELAIPTESRREDSPAVMQEDIDTLEKDIDRMNESLEMLKSFILPGGNELSSRIHIARSVCRRAERAIFALHDVEPCDSKPALISYINRLSDWLFVAARHVCRVDSVSETLWES